MPELPDIDPAERSPEDRGLQDRSDTPSVSPWLVIALILMLGAVIYVVSAMTGR